MSDALTLPRLANLLTGLADRLAKLERKSNQPTGRQTGVTVVSTTAAVSGSAAATHDLGAVPQVQACAQNSTGGLTNVCVDSITSTGFNISIRYVDGTARTASVSVAWEAIA